MRGQVVQVSRQDPYSRPSRIHAPGTTDMVLLAFVRVSHIAKGYRCGIERIRERYCREKEWSDKGEKRELERELERQKKGRIGGREHTHILSLSLSNI